ncbi:hypothetical protein [Enterococcus sp. DIV0240a]|jgi:hypothetical protein|uniref:hypothetical protein n=1 Tax=unclassified Enterococcus TaxID=2608891 RepID=UPI003D2D209F
MPNNELFIKVKLFLQNFRECAKQGRIDFSEINTKTSKFLRKYGITYAAMHAYILENIEEKHYFRGPAEHHYFPNRTVTEFGMDWDGIKIYVKLELILNSNQFFAGYLSFHEREKEIENFPLDEKGEVI